MKRWSYQGRWALVTGASAGIGAVLAERLAGRGMNVVLTARRTERLEELAERLRGDHGVQVVSIAADLARREEAPRLWHAANDGQRIDLLVNNAGFGAQGRFDEVSVERHVELVELNCVALMQLAHFAIRSMRAGAGGGIINVASIAAFQPVPMLGSYAASKAFVLSLSEALWAENREHGIRVLALCPGRTPTEFQAIAGTGAAEGSFGYRTPEQVVDAGLLAFERGKSYVVPGAENLAATWVARAIPHSTLTRAMKRLVRRMWNKKP